jgi:hypothetical protein
MAEDDERYMLSYNRSVRRIIQKSKKVSKYTRSVKVSPHAVYIQYNLNEFMFSEQLISHQGDLKNWPRFFQYFHVRFAWHVEREGFKFIYHWTTTLFCEQNTHFKTLAS